MLSGLWFFSPWPRQCDRATGLEGGDTGRWSLHQGQWGRLCWRGETWSPMALSHETRPVTGSQENKINRKKKNKYSIQMKANNNEIGKMRMVLLKNIKSVWNSQVQRGKLWPAIWKWKKNFTNNKGRDLWCSEMIERWDFLITVGINLQIYVKWMFSNKAWCPN